MYVCTWIFCWSVCEFLHVCYYLVGIEILGFFCVSYILSENEWRIKYVFDPLMGVINIFGGDGVWTFIGFIRLIILIDCCER